MSHSTLSPQEHENLRTALFLIETLPPQSDTPTAEIEPMLTRFRIRGNAPGLIRFATRSLRAALGESVEGAEPPDVSSWVILDDYRWVSSDLLLSEQTLASMRTRYTLSSQRKINRKAALYRAVPWFVIGLLTTPAIYFTLTGIGVILGMFGIDIHLSH
jgi:hypothetical protein